MRTDTRTWFRRRANPVGQAITAVAVALIAIGSVSFLSGTERKAFAALEGAVTFADGSGDIVAGGGGDFTMKLPQGAACQGSGGDNYRWETFLVSATVDLGALTFGDGPGPVAGSFVSAMFSADGEPVSTKFPSQSPLGLISGIPQLSLPNTATPLAAGSYKIGIACQLSGAIQEFWSTTITVGAEFAWVVDSSTAATSTTSTTTAASTTTTVTGGSTTTTIRGASTTTTSAAATTTSALASTTTLFGSGGVTTFPSYAIVATGGSPVPLLVWAILLLVFGRIVILLGRPLRVLPPRQ